MHIQDFVQIFTVNERLTHSDFISLLYIEAGKRNANYSNSYIFSYVL